MNHKGEAGFKITGSRGFHITFKNGVTVSIQFGDGSYSDNYDLDIGSESKMRQLQSTNAEIAIWKQDGTWVTKEFRSVGDDVLSRVTPEEVLDALNWASNSTLGD